MNHYYHCLGTDIKPSILLLLTISSTRLWYSFFTAVTVYKTVKKAASYPMKWYHLCLFLQWNDATSFCFSNEITCTTSLGFPSEITPSLFFPSPVSPAKQPHFFFCFITSHFHSAGCQGKSFTAGCAVQANERLKNNDELTINRWHTHDMTPLEIRICTNAFRS